MKQKYLLSMLFGGAAMLTACSVDDDLKLASVAKDANPSAPVFSISFVDDEDPMTRATYEHDGNWVRFDKNDLLSLYNGYGDKEDANFTTSATGYNAIYYGEQIGDNEGAVEWFSQAMVRDGGAIMVYPADTAHYQITGTPTVSIARVQNDSAFKCTPYISSAIMIGEYKADADSSVAGYRKKYDIKMKRAAGMVAVKINLKETEAIKTAVAADEVKPAEIQSVTLKSNNDIFTLTMPITVSSTKKEDKAHTTWLYETKLDNSSTNECVFVNSIETKKIKDGYAYFNFLPFKNTLLNATANDLSSLGTVSMVVKTTYGEVTINGTDNIANPVKGSTNTKYTDVKDKDEITLTEFLRYIIMTNVETQSTLDDFKDEYAGLATIGQKLAVEVDLANVNMEDMHIETGANLETAIKLYSIIKESKEPATFRLVGNDNKKFEMTKTQWQALENQLALKDNKLTVVLCDGNDGGEDNEDECGYKECETLKLLNTETIEIPDFKFATAVPVELAGENGTWTYPSDPTFYGVSKLTLVEGKLNLNKDVTAGAVTEQQQTAGLENGLEIAKDGIVNVTGEVTLKVNTTNFGVINIGTSTASANLYVEGVDVSLTNEAAAVKTASKPNEVVADYEEYCWKECGRIYNYGGLGVANTGKIYNYGLINSENDNAKTLITENATNTIDLTQASSTNNKVGSIVLHRKDQVVAVDGAKGFIKFSLPSSVTTMTLNDCGSLANYIIVDSDNTKDLKAALSGNTQPTYLEIANKNFEITANNSFDAVIVKKGTEVSITPGVTVGATGTIYMKGNVFHAGVENTTGCKWEDAGKGNTSFFGKSDGRLIFTGKK